MRRASFLLTAVLISVVSAGIGVAWAHHNFFVFSNGADFAIGHDHRDTFYLQDGNDYFATRGDIDEAYGGGNQDNGGGEGGGDGIFGGDGNDKLNCGQNCSTVISGNANDDWVNGEGGNDGVAGGDHVDVILGGGGDDDLYADDGYTDTYIDGESGADTCRVDSWESSVSCARY